MLDSFSHDVMLGVAVIVLGFMTIASWSLLRWKKLKPKLFPDKIKGASGTAGGSVGAVRPGDILRMAQSWLAAKESSPAKAALAALAEIAGSSQAMEELSGMFSNALETDDVASLLLRRGDSYSYLLAVPDRYENARGLGRYAGFADGWQWHLTALRDRIGAGASSVQLIAFLFFLDPNRGESALLLSFADKGGIAVPAALAGTGVRSTSDSEGTNLSLEFRLAA